MLATRAHEMSSASIALFERHEKDCERRHQESREDKKEINEKIELIHSRISNLRKDVEAGVNGLRKDVEAGVAKVSEKTDDGFKSLRVWMISTLLSLLLLVLGAVIAGALSG